jgi:hypothetical protein
LGSIATIASLARRFIRERKMAETDTEDTELRVMVMRYRRMEEETTDPMAMRFLRDIVSELERKLNELRRK